MFEAKSFNKQNADHSELLSFCNNEISMFDEHSLFLNIDQDGLLSRFMTPIFSSTASVTLSTADVTHLIQFNDTVSFNLPKQVASLRTFKLLICKATSTSLTVSFTSAVFKKSSSVQIISLNKEMTLISNESKPYASSFMQTLKASQMTLIIKNDKTEPNNATQLQTAELSSS